MTQAAASIGRNRVRTALLFLAPLTLFYLVFYAYSFFYVGFASFFDTDATLRDLEFVGLDNYELLLTHDRFWTAIFNTIGFALVGIAAALTIGFFLAVVLSTKLRGHGFFYAVFFLPALMPMSLVASVFGVMLASRSGTVNEILRFVGMGDFTQRWLGDPTLAWISVGMIFVYVIGLPIMYYTADLSTINISLLEAAVVDGAGAWPMLRLILFPLLVGARRTIILSILLGTFRAFEVVYLSTGGGPSGRTEIAGTYLYTFATSGVNVGYVSAASVVVLLCALSISIINLILQKRGERR